VRVTRDETMFNDVVFFSRRGEETQSYIQHIKPHPPVTQKSGAYSTRV
jgi:hypothetical protein